MTALKIHGVTPKGVLAFVGADETRVRMRFTATGATWRCDRCGRSRPGLCWHAKAVADHLNLNTKYREDH